MSPDVVPVTVVGTGDGSKLEPGLLVTQGSQPNLIINVVSPLVAIIVRFAHTLITLMLGIIGAGMVTDVLPAKEFSDLFWLSFKLSLSGAIVAAMKDVVTILGKLESKFPLLTGGV